MPGLQEVARSNRVLDIITGSNQAAETLADARFKYCMLMTPFNKAVFQFVIHRAQSFATATQQQLFWMQAIDNPPSWFAGTMSQEELQKMEEKWLQHHARKTEGVLSICPLCCGLPLRITNGNGYLCKRYGIHNGATCVLEGWELAEPDIATAKENKESQTVLSSLPVKLIVRMDRPLKEPYTGLPDFFRCLPLLYIGRWTQRIKLKSAGVASQWCQTSAPRLMMLQAEPWVLVSQT